MKACHSGCVGRSIAVVLAEQGCGGRDGAEVSPDNCRTRVESSWDGLLSEAGPTEGEGQCAATDGSLDAL